jgi:hypothetical protein
MGRTGRTPLNAKKTKIFCRICGPDKAAINRQSYRDHLSAVHGDLSGNLREYGQQSLFGARISAPTAQEDRDHHRVGPREDSGAGAGSDDGEVGVPGAQPPGSMEEQQDSSEEAGSHR